MNWKELRPLLREKFGHNFFFYNDLYKSGTRRIKICTQNSTDMCFFIKCLNPELDVKLYESQCKWGGGIRTRVTIHYR